jgi:hypothetical protein
MSHSYVAYGLQLDADFQLPGMRARADGSLPRLRLELGADGCGETRARGEREWSGRLGDGRELTIDRHASGERVFGYGERARFVLAADCATLRCEPLRDDLHWRRALLSKVLPSVSVMRGYEALHAGAVSSPRGAIAIAAPAGMGKSTLALELMRRGWPLLSDDVSVLSHERGRVQVHAGTPHMNLDPEATLAGELSELAVLAGERWVSACSPADGAPALHAVVLLERSSRLTLEVERLAPSPLPLAPYVLGLAPEAERRRSRFLLYGAMMDTALLVRLTCSLDDEPERVAEALQGALQAEECLA